MSHRTTDEYIIASSSTVMRHWPEGNCLRVLLLELLNSSDQNLYFPQIELHSRWKETLHLSISPRSRTAC
jgi:hypothetical protein